MVSVVDLRKKGIKAVEEELEENGSAVISFKGKPKYVMLPIEAYEKMELDLAYAELKRAQEQGNAYSSSAKELIARIEDAL